MSEQPQIVFDDGAAYDDFMGVWSRSVGEKFLAWTRPEKGLDWIDVGCGNGAFTELVVRSAAPKSVLGVDPSEGQLSFAREHHTAGIARFEKAGAEALPAADHSFDAAVMALVIFFVPNPAKGVAEMRRVVKSGGQISAYAWDILGGGFPLDVIGEELIALGIPAPLPPSVEVARLDALKKLWSDGGLTDVETTAITVERTFADFETLWRINLKGPRLAQTTKSAASDVLAKVKANVKARLSPDASGRITCQARANAVKGRASAH